MKFISLFITILIGLSPIINCATTPEATPVPQETPTFEGKLAYKGPKKRIAVVDFVNKSGFGAGRLGQSAADILTTEMVKSEQFIVIERAKLDKLLQEQGFGMSGVVDPATAAKAGKILGVNAILTGSISQFGIKQEGSDLGFYARKVQKSEASVDIRVVDTITAQVLLADTGVGEAESSSAQILGVGTQGGFDETLAGKALRSAIVKLIDNIVNQLQTVEWSGKIAAVKEGSVYINAGQETGLKIGDILQVQSLGDEIIDPDTGLTLGRVIGEIKGKLEVTEFFGTDGSIAKPISGKDFQTGDMVKLGL